MNLTVTDQADTLPIYLKSPEARIIANGQKRKKKRKENMSANKKGYSCNLDQDHKSVTGLCTGREEEGQYK